MTTDEALDVRLRLHLAEAANPVAGCSRMEAELVALGRSQPDARERVAAAYARLSSGGQPLQEPLRPTLARWLNRRHKTRDHDGQPSERWSKVLAHKGSYDQFAYGTNTDSDWAGPLQVCFVCSPWSGMIAVDVDDEAGYMTTRTARHVTRADAISTRGDHFHVLVDARSVPPDQWPRQGPIPGGDIKSNGFIPVPGCLHWSEERYAPVLHDGLSRVVPATPEMIAAINADRNEHHPAANGNGKGGTGGGHDGEIAGATLTMVLRRMRAGWQPGTELTEDVYREWVTVAVPRDPSYPFDRDDFDRHYGGALHKALEIIGNDQPLPEGAMEWALSTTAQQGLAALNGQPLTPDPEETARRRETAAGLAYDRRRAEQDARERLEAESLPRVRVLSLAEVRAMPPPEDIVVGMVPAPVPGGSCVGEMFGQSGAFKSFLMWHLALCIDSGRPFLGQPVLRTGASALILGEGQAGAGIRADAALDAHPEFTACQRVHVLPGSFSLANAAEVSAVIAALRDIAELRLVWLDSLADFYGAEDENSASGMSRILAGMRRISAELGCTVAGSGHTGHGTRDEDGTEQPAARRRGSTRLYQGWDFQLQATGSHLLVRKEREDEMLPPVPYRAEKHGRSLAIADDAPAYGVRAQVPDTEPWPHPVPEALLSRVVAAVKATPGLSANGVFEIVKGRKQMIPVALAVAAQGGLVRNAGTASAAKWVPGPVWEMCEAMGWS